MIVLLVMMLLSALMIGFMTNIMADTRSSGVDRDETQAYAVAHAGMEKLTSDMAQLFNTDYSPNGSQISDKAADSMKPVMPGFVYMDTDGTSGYKVQFTAQKSGSTALCTDVPSGCEVVQTPAYGRTPMPDDPTTGTTIAAGPYQGFKGLVTHYNIMVTARSSRNCAATDIQCLQAAGGSEVRMRRELQTVAVPVFQFGLFSESNLAFHAGGDFNFGGRIHTNSNLFLTSGDNTTLTLSDKVTALGEIVRKYIDNGSQANVSGGWNGTVKMAKGSTGGGAPQYGTIAFTEGSVIDNVPAAGCTAASSPACLNDPTWHDLSVGTFNGYIRNGRTGAKRLDLPLVAYGAKPIDLIRRPNPPVAPVTQKENVTAPLVYGQRYYSQASLRILLSDKDTDLTSLPQIDTTTGPINLEATGAANSPTQFGTSPVKSAYVAKSAGNCNANAGCYKSTSGTSLIGGWIKIELQKTDGTWQDVTSEILGYGFVGKNLSNGTFNTPFTPATPNGRGSGSTQSTLNSCLKNEPHPDAIIRLQRIKDVPSTDGSSTWNYDCGFTNAGFGTTANDYWPLALYDTREGEKRTDSTSNNARDVSYSGVMYYIELDTNNLAKWFMRSGSYSSGTGNLAKNDNNGYIVYFSDRRNNRNASGAETGDYGNEDIINSGAATNTPNGTLETAEDVNGNMWTCTPATTPCPPETYGTVPNYGGAYNTVPTAAAGATAPLLDNSTRVNDVLTANSDTALANNLAVVRANRPIFFRRALKLTNGGSLSATGISGLTIAAENPIYVQGNYNSSASNTPTESHIAAAIIADTVVVLSNAWNDIDSFYMWPSKPKDVYSTAQAASPKLPHTMAAVDTGYRFAAVSGKTISFTKPSWATSDKDFGDDGGAHNLLHLLEDWSNKTMYYRGSLVSFYISRQLTGIYKASDFTYVPPGTRTYNFDTDFLIPSKLPPGTPMFRDVNTLTFRQILRPNQ